MKMLNLASNLDYQRDTLNNLDTQIQDVDY